VLSRSGGNWGLTSHTGPPPKLFVVRTDTASGAANMSIFKRDTKQDEQLEGEIGEFVRRDVAAVRRHTDNIHTVATDNISSLLQRVSANSLQEIDEIITRLEMLRDRLRNERARVQRRIEEYASLCQAAIQSTKVIAESLNHCTTQRRA
jgi:hypothetical protein